MFYLQTTRAPTILLPPIHQELLPLQEGRPLGQGLRPEETNAVLRVQEGGTFRQ